MLTSIRRLLESRPIEASAPCRVDSGGTWDIKTMALPLEHIRPVTLNMALSLRTWVTLLPFEEGRVGVSSKGFPGMEQYPLDAIPFTSPFGLFFAAISYFGFHGLHVHIRSDSPVKSALGGSSTAIVALIKALCKMEVLLGREEMPAGRVLHLAYHLEDGVAKGKCGIQDQAAAVYGGVHLWMWRYGGNGPPFRRIPLLNRKGQRELSDRILIAYSGKSHVSSRINRTWLEDFLSGRTREGWIKANDIVNSLANALGEKDWNKAAGLLREEMAVRKEITPDALIPITERLVEQAEGVGCGARFAGAGGGGSVWALGERDRIEQLKKLWASTLSSTRGGRILPCAIDPVGVR